MLWVSVPETVLHLSLLQLTASPPAPPCKKVSTDTTNGKNTTLRIILLLQFWTIVNFVARLQWVDVNRWYSARGTVERPWDNIFLSHFSEGCLSFPAVQICLSQYTMWSTSKIQEWHHWPAGLHYGDRHYRHGPKRLTVPWMLSGAVWESHLTQWQWQTLSTGPLV